MAEDESVLFSGLELANACKIRADKRISEIENEANSVKEEVENDLKELCERLWGTLEGLKEQVDTQIVPVRDELINLRRSINADFQTILRGVHAERLEPSSREQEQHYAELQEEALNKAEAMKRREWESQLETVRIRRPDLSHVRQAIRLLSISARKFEQNAMLSGSDSPQAISNTPSDTTGSKTSLNSQKRSSLNNSVQVESDPKNYIAHVSHGTSSTPKSSVHDLSASFEGIPTRFGTIRTNGRHSISPNTKKGFKPRSPQQLPYNQVETFYKHSLSAQYARSVINWTSQLRSSPSKPPVSPSSKRQGEQLCRNKKNIALPQRTGTPKGILCDVPNSTPQQCRHVLPQEEETNDVESFENRDADDSGTTWRRLSFCGVFDLKNEEEEKKRFTVSTVHQGQRTVVWNALFYGSVTLTTFIKVDCVEVRESGHLQLLPEEPIWIPKGSMLHIIMVEQNAITRREQRHGKQKKEDGSMLLTYITLEKMKRHLMSASGQGMSSSSRLNRSSSSINSPKLSRASSGSLLSPSNSLKTILPLGADEALAKSGKICHVDVTVDLDILGSKIQGRLSVNATLEFIKKKARSVAVSASTSEDDFVLEGALIKCLNLTIENIKV